ncbi:MAG: zf-HC2 domain-containing protein [Planctomycetes bacterium]|nr:zf-HC2 domain-containing protein [Planctomycetota bacterium]
MNCDDYRDLIPLVAGGEADENERIAVEAHVSMCPDCARELEEFRAAREMLGELKEGNVPADAVDGIWPNVRRELFPVRAFGVDWFVRAAAVLVIGLSIGFVAVVATRDRTAPTAREAAALSVRRGAESVDAGSGPRSTFAGSGRDADLSTLFEERAEDRRAPLPRFSRPESGHYLPRAEAVVASGERSF